MIRLRAGGATDIGLVRTANQDQLLVADPLYAVADGMGGAAAGEVASEIAVSALAREFDKSGAATADHLVAAARAANRAVWEEAEAHLEMRGMGTTLVALILTESGELAAVNIGDSRLYAFHDGELRQVTSDHNLVAEMVLQGRLTPEQAEVHPRRNVITRVLGVDPEVAVDLFVEEAVAGDRYLLCSDGLPREVSDDFLAAMLRRLADPQEAAKALVDAARNRGGNDNITVVVVDVVDVDDDDTGPPEATIALTVPEPDGTGEAGTDAEEPEPEEPASKENGAGREATSKRARRLRRLPVVRDRPDARPKERFITVRVVVFAIAVLLVLAAGIGAIVWYAESGWFVKLQGQNLVIYQGRPGGVLWIQPTVAETSQYGASDVLPVHLPALQAGVQESSLEAAQQYIQRLVLEKDAASETVPTTTPTTVTPTTLTPTTTTVTPTTVKHTNVTPTTVAHSAIATVTAGVAQ